MSSPLSLADLRSVKDCGHRRTHSDAWSFTSAVTEEDIDDNLCPPESIQRDSELLPNLDTHEHSMLQHEMDYVALPASLGATQMSWLKKAAKARGCDYSAVLRAVFAEFWREQVPIFPDCQPLLQP